MNKKIIFLILPFLLVACGEEVKIPFENYKISKSNTTIDCQGKKFNDGKITEILIGPKVKNVIIKNCELKGSIRFYGLGMNGNTEGVRSSSHTEGHTERAKNAAPSNVLIGNLNIEGVQRIPIYLGPGTNNIIITDSVFTGSTPSTVMYLDAESSDNIIKNNTFKTKSEISLSTLSFREVIAIDGSANNTIINNNFETVYGGGIYLYRNCGENGTIRHQTPNNNRIIGNTFQLKEMISNQYAIWLGSRNGDRSYCDDDKGYSFGSSNDNRDFADNNIIKSNNFIGSSNTIKDNGTNNQINF